MPLDDSVDLESLAERCSGYAAADLIALAREAVLHAARRHAAAQRDAGNGGEDQIGGAGDAVADDPDGGTDGGSHAAACPPPTVYASDFERALVSSRAAVLRPATSVTASEPLKWDSIGGAVDVKRRLRRAIEWPIQRPEHFAALGIRPPRGVLMHGPPGGGKTSLARAAASASGVVRPRIATAADTIHTPWMLRFTHPIHALYSRRPC